MRKIFFLKKEYIGFWKYVFERQKIWYQRFVLKEPFPWTEDPILQKFHFCNCYRELDRGTIYLIDKLMPIRNQREKILFNIFAYRFFNFYGFFDKVGLIEPKNYDPFAFIKKLDDLIAKGEKIFNPAYLVIPKIIKKNWRAKAKHVQLAFALEILKRKLKKLLKGIDLSFAPQESFEILKQIPSVGNFLGYEIWTDLTYFGFFKQGWTDDDFVNVGPGAIWGLNIMMGKDTKNLLFSEDFYVKLIFALRDNMKEALKQLNLLKEWLKIAFKAAFSNKPFLSLRNIEHSLCEYRKYWRIKNKKLTRKRLFKFKANQLPLGGIEPPSPA